jgi:mannose-1-phosphate guanylyltransferase
MLPLTGGAALLREAVLRLDGLVAPANTLVITAARHVAAVRELLPELPPQNIVGEPRARNTAAACALATWIVHDRDPDATLAILPADHVIDPAESLRADLAAAALRAQDADVLLTLGLTPTRPATGYGWIRLGEAVAEPAGKAVHKVDRFLEKPDRETAEQLLVSRGHVWNLGMFVWRTSVFLRELATHLPQVATPFEGLGAKLRGPDGQTALTEAFDGALGISVDYGVFERSACVECIPCQFKWDDLGSFAAVARHLPTDEHGNVGIGARIAEDAQDCIVWSGDDGLTALLGVRGLIVVHTESVTLVAPRERAEDIRDIVARLPGTALEKFA